MRAVFVVALLLGINASFTVNALEIEKFFMPGDVIEGHADLETECTNCHVRLRDTTQEKLCLDCHDLVREDIERKRGYHGKNSKASSLNCKTCHSEHKGREAQVVWLDQDTFDHRQTDFLLRGKHVLAECSACHLPDKKHREAEQACYACHAEDDAHDGQLGKKCADCHQETGWGKSEFDHDKTEFKLRASHRKVNCDACHIQSKFEGTPKTCVGCHKIRDVHDNRFGSKCETCHTEKKWRETSFDHDRDTKFRLHGLHRNQSCNACHSVAYQARKKDRNRVRSCYACHREDDPHRGTNGKKCQDCHGSEGWHLTEFDHNRKTRFPLRGGHADIACEACHLPGNETRPISTDCVACHRSNDTHRGDLGKNCGQCHNETAWRHRVRFDHDLSSFPLIGQHAVLGCEACHASSQFSQASSACNDCHREDDPHERAFGDTCSDCHNPNAWLIWQLDHDDTRFRLKGVHQELHCHSCHNRPLEQQRRKRWQCVDCHWRDDIHEGNFGGRCDKCHDQESFRNPDIRSQAEPAWLSAGKLRIQP